MKKALPRAGLFTRQQPAAAETRADMRSLLLKLGESFKEDANRADIAKYLDHAADVARSLSSRLYDAHPNQSPTDGASKWASEILSRVEVLREQLRSDIAPSWLTTRRLMDLVRLEMEAQIEFGLGRSYSAGAKSIVAARSGAHLTAQKRAPKIQAKHTKWETLDAGLPSALSLGKRSELIARKVANTDHAGRADTIRKYLSRKKSGKVPATLPNCR